MPRNRHADPDSSALTCTRVQAGCWAFVDGLLTPSERASVQQHLQTCAACRLEMDRCRSLETALRSAATQIPPAGDLRAGFYSRLAAERTRSHRTGWLVAVPAFAVGILLLSLARPALHSLWNPHATPTPMPETETVLRRDASRNHSATSLDSAPALARRTVPGLSEETVDRLFIRTDTKALTVAATHHASISRLRRAGLRSVSKWHGTIVAYASTKKADALGESLAASVQRRAKLSTADSTFALAANAKKTEIAALPDLKASLLEGRPSIVAALLPAEGGVSLQVADEVRGFTSTTRLASDVSAEDSEGTIHIEADGN